MFTFRALDQKYPFGENLVSRLWPSSNMMNSMVTITFSLLDRKYPFWANFVQEVKIASS